MKKLNEKNSVFNYFEWIIAGFWAIIALTIYFQVVDTCPFSEGLLFILTFFIIVFSVSTFLSTYLLNRALNNENMRVFIIQFIIVTLLLALFLAYHNKGFVWLESQRIYPPSRMISGMQRPFYLDFGSNIASALAINIALCGLRFFEKHYKMLQEHAKLQQAHLEDQLQLLKEQINPHLMFNVLNHIHILMKKNVDLADELLVRFSNILRYQLYECNRETVLLEKEADYLKDVIEVETMRWGNELKVESTWEIEDGGKQISPLLLIPFVENAFKHVSRLPSKNGYINISFNQHANELHLVVENSKSDQNIQRNNASGIGLENVKKRLDILYPQKHSLDILKTDSLYKTTLIISL